MAEPALELERLEVRYGTVVALRELTLQVGRGELVGLIGPNGAGKSTTLHAIMGAVPAEGGQIRLHGRPIRGRSPESIARAGVALVPEGRRIFGDFTVEENLRLGLAGHKKRDGSKPLRAAYDLFPMLREFRRRSAGELSGGQQQQLAIARALVAEPDVLLLDEPSLGLAPLAVESVFEALRAIHERGVSILVVEQRALHTVALCDRTHVLVGGELRLTLGPDDAKDRGKIVAAYLAS
jgi:branched-chain amino acid transport system ATP-binding protein